jgi:hypothetical protein
LEGSHLSVQQFLPPNVGNDLLMGSVHTVSGGAVSCGSSWGAALLRRLPAACRDSTSGTGGALDPTASRHLPFAVERSLQLLHALLAIL